MSSEYHGRVNKLPPHPRLAMNFRITMSTRMPSRPPAEVSSKLHGYSEEDLAPYAASSAACIAPLLQLHRKLRAVVIVAQGVDEEVESGSCGHGQTVDYLSR